MADPGRVSLMGTATRWAAVAALAIGMAIMGAAGCTSTNAAAQAQAAAERAERSASHAEAAANNAQKAADAANVAAQRAQKAVEDADREITKVEQRLDVLLKNAPRNRHHHERHPAKRVRA
jgi:flagellar motility protein MotE (MotC chaperone)